ncbi:MAG: translation initiation factor IF-2 [Deltaproteobacteria bacterium]|nr:MAG: translation initiation factor IF-2 [Deltaproteobacteria bacterium]
MSKRVYEVALELGMSSKDLVVRLPEMGILVQNDMNFLTDDDIRKIRAQIQAGPARKAESYIEKRVKPGVIRRRRKPRQKEETPTPVEPGDGMAATQEATSRPVEAPKPVETDVISKPVEAEVVPAGGEEAADLPPSRSEGEPPSALSTVEETSEAAPSAPRSGQEPREGSHAEDVPQEQEEAARTEREEESEAPEVAPTPAMATAPSSSERSTPDLEASVAEEGEKTQDHEAVMETAAPAPQTEETPRPVPSDTETPPTQERAEEEVNTPESPTLESPQRTSAETQETTSVETQPSTSADSAETQEAASPEVQPTAKRPPTPPTPISHPVQRPKRRDETDTPAKVLGWVDPATLGIRPPPKPRPSTPRRSGEAPVSPPPTGAGKPRRRRREVIHVTKEDHYKRRAPRRTGKGIEPPKHLRSLEDAEFDEDRLLRKQRKKKGKGSATGESSAPPKPAKRVLKLSGPIVLGDLGKKIGVKAGTLIQTLMKMGSMVAINQTIDVDTATLLCSEFGWEVENVTFEVEDLLPKRGEDAEEKLQPRAPVVTVMGHVDHGKTSLLDAIRHTNVTDREAGGITQHIGAYFVKHPKGDIVFLDTPGHEAFTAMRARGARVTDIVVLVVAADDGVKPQTVEAINHAKAAEVPIIVAINKIDKPEANPDRVKQMLTEYGLVPEEWGGETLMTNVSAKQGTGIDELLEMILLQAELLDLKANPDKPGIATVIEAKLDKGKGPVATVIVEEGSLSIGDHVVSGPHFGKIKMLIDDRGNRIEKAGPSMPVEISGLSSVPNVGDLLCVVPDEAKARQIAEHYREEERKKSLERKGVSLTDWFERTKQDEIKELNVLVKGDVQGSVEVVTDALQKLTGEKVRIKVVHSAVGAINEGDVMLASASNAIIIGFNIRPDAKVREIAEKEMVDIRLYTVIYDMVEDIKQAMTGLLSPIRKERVLGRAEVRDLFSIPKVGTVAGCFVTDGKILRGAHVRLLRDNRVVYEGKIKSLRRFKEDVKEVASGYECGIGIENYNDVKLNDVIEAYTYEEVAATL